MRQVAIMSVNLGDLRAVIAIQGSVVCSVVSFCVVLCRAVSCCGELCYVAV